LKLYNMIRKSHSGILAILLILCIVSFLGYYYRIPLWEKIVQFYDFLSNRQQINTFITSFGSGAPLVFLVIQILQVIFAPIPGEATGFIGGYLFGTVKGFLYSSIGLAIGSWLNFIIGRFLGKQYVRKMIPPKHLERFDTLIKHQGIFVLFLLFVFPGFPKDYLCLFLGLTAIPIKAFLLLAVVGRMPGTFMLSLQGALLFEKNYYLITSIIVLFVGLTFFAYRYREIIYQWVEKLNGE